MEAGFPASCHGYAWRLRQGGGSDRMAAVTERRQWQGGGCGRVASVTEWRLWKDGAVMTGWKEMYSMVILETRRLVIREMEMGDLDALYDLYEDDGAKRYLEPLSADRQEERDKLSAYIDFVYAFYGFGLWAVCDRTTGRLVGRCGFSVEEIDDEVYVEIGYMIDRSRRREGLGLEAVRAVLDYGWEELGLDSIAACISPDNQASAALAQKAGFTYQKTFMRRGHLFNMYIRHEKTSASMENM